MFFQNRYRSKEDTKNYFLVVVLDDEFSRKKETFDFLKL